MKNDVVGWGSPGAAWTDNAALTLSRACGAALQRLGVREAFGLLGGGIAPFAAGLAAAGLPFRSFRHESGAGFAAIEAHHASQRPTLVVLTTGPGLANAENAVRAARVDGAKLIVISGLTSAHQRGRGAVQETTPQTMVGDWYRPGPLFHLATAAESVDEVLHFFTRLQVGLLRPGGFVAHLALPLSLQTLVLDRPLPTPQIAIPSTAPTTATLDAVLERLRDPRAIVWAGHGATSAWRDLRTFIEAAALPMMTSPRAKGVLHHRDALHIGMTGAGGGKAAQAFCADRPPSHALVLGTRLSEVTTFFAPQLAPSGSIVHVDADVDAFGAGYPGTDVLGVVGDAAVVVAGLLERAGATGFFAGRRALGPEVRAAVAAARAVEEDAPGAVPASSSGDVDPRALMAAIQRVVVDGSDALVMSEAGTSFTWCNAWLRFSEPGRYRTSAAWGSMGHVTAGSVGAAISGARPVVAVVGDGAMLMNNEINTAVQYGARVVWVVMNDAQLGLNEHGMRALGMTPVETQLPRTDFVQFARSQGADGIAVTSATDLDSALCRGLGAGGPFVVDVRVDREVPSPVVADRIASLRRQGAGQ